MRVLGVDPTDLAYAAGLFDGEGCVSVYQHHGFCVDVRVAMTTPAPLQWLVACFGGAVKRNRSQGQYNVRSKECWYWKISTKQAREFLAAIRPWLKVKHEHADTVLNLTFNKRGPWITQTQREERELAMERLKALNKRGWL